jgi:hypothetical protein
VIISLEVSFRYEEISNFSNSPSVKSWIAQHYILIIIRFMTNLYKIRNFVHIKPKKMSLCILVPSPIFWFKVGFCKEFIKTSITFFTWSPFLMFLMHDHLNYSKKNMHI